MRDHTVSATSHTDAAHGSVTRTIAMHHCRHRSTGRRLARTAAATLLAAAVLVAVAAPLSPQDHAAADAGAERAVPRSAEAAGEPRGMRIHLDEQGRPTPPPAKDTRAAAQASTVQAAAPV